MGHVPSDNGLEAKIKQYDPFLFLKWNEESSDYEVWTNPYPSDCKVHYCNRPAPRRLLKCEGVLDSRILERLYEMDVENRRNESIEKMITKMENENTKISLEKAIGTPEQRGLEIENATRYAFNNGLIASSAGKLR